VSERRDDGGVVGGKDGGSGSDQRHRWSVGHESLDQLPAHVTGGCRVMSQIVHQGDAVVVAEPIGAGREGHRSPEAADRGAGVLPGQELEVVLCGAIGPIEGEARDDLCNSLNICLGVGLHAVDDPERMQLEELTGVVLVHPAGCRRVVVDIVEVVEHRCALG